ncbi:MAG: hypothetical protein QNL04_01790 [SAR324 cluster bacterium]|nr:hypothetical protein [SAR324 cluster bacterium]
MKALLIFFFAPLLISGQLLAQTVISGAVIGPKGPAAVGLSVVLLSSTGKRPIERVKTAEGGKFIINLNAPDPKLTYQLGTRYAGELFATPPFTVKQGQRSVTMDIEIQTIINGPFVVTGKMVMGDGTAAPVDLQVVLIEQLPGAKSPAPVMMRKTNEKGGYKFEADTANPGSKYFLTAKAGRTYSVSNYIQFAEGTKNYTVDLEVPAVSLDQSQISVSKNIVFFDLYEDYIQLSEMLIFENKGDSLVDTFDTPMQKELPAGTYHFDGNEREEQSVSAFDGKLMIRMLIPPGRSQVFFNYRLPKSNALLTWGIFAGTSDFELISSGAGIELDFVGQQMGSNKTRSKHQSNQTFVSNKTKISPDQKLIQVDISGIGVEQRKLFYPATFLLIFLLIGLFWYSKIRKPDTKD